MTITRTNTVILAVAVLILSVISLTAGAAPDDRYLAGYAAAVLETRFGLPSRELQVENGKLRLRSADLQGQDTGEVLASLRAIDGLEVELIGTPTEARSVSSSAKPTPLPSATLSETTGWLPRAALFDPLIADPRWPRFSATLQFYQHDEELGTVGAPNFGAAIPFYGWRGLGIDWQAGLHAGVFSIFDLNADSSDLINSDFFVALPISARHGPLSAQVRLFHQSSHLGDEFLLRNRVDRINLSYEGADLRLSVKPWDWLRFYAGGGGTSTPNRSSIPGWCKAASSSRARARSTLISSIRSWRSMFSRSRNRIGRSTIRRAPVLKFVANGSPPGVCSW